MISGVNEKNKTKKRRINITFVLFIGHRFSEAVFKLKNQRYAERKLCPIKNSKKTMKGVPVR